MTDAGQDEPAAGAAVTTTVEEAVQAVRAVDTMPLQEHAGRYKSLHSVLQDALSDTDPDLRAG